MKLHYFIKIIKRNILFILIFFCAIAQVIILNHDSTSGEKISAILVQIEQTEEENNKLTQKIASASAIAAISDKVKKMGFVQNTTTVSLVSPLPIAFSAKTSL